MKCPHCGFVSFEHLDTCKKCVKDLSAHKSQFGIDFPEPVSLGILSFVEGAGSPAGSPDDSGSFAADDFSLADDAGDGMTVVEVESDENSGGGLLDDEIAIDATEEVTLDFGGSDDDASLYVNDDDDDAAMASDSGFSLDLGEDALGSESDSNDSDDSELSLSIDDELDVVLEADEEGDEFEVALDDDVVDSALSDQSPADDADVSAQEIVMEDDAISLEGIEFDSLDNDGDDIVVDLEEESQGAALTLDESDESGISLDLDEALADDESIVLGDIGVDDLEVMLDEEPAPASTDDDEISLSLEGDDDDETLSLELDDLDLEIGVDDYDLDLDD